MNINIAGNLKRLRKQREITQEDLADFIGVSFQAVSKWERGDTYPDITIVPAIANFFDVTVDELIGMNEIKNAVKIEEIMQEAESMYRGGGKGNEAIELIREALKTYPNDYGLLAKLADFLSWNYYLRDEETYKKNNAEAVKICERILKFCTDTEIRKGVQLTLCLNLYRSGEREKAVEHAKKLPHIHETRERWLPEFLRGREQLEETQKAIGDYVYGLYQQIWLNILNPGGEYGGGTHYTTEEKIKICQKMIDINKIIFESGEESMAFMDIEYYFFIEHCNLKLGNTDEAIAALEKVAEQAIAQSKLPEMGGIFEYKSLLANTRTRTMHSKVSGSNPEGKNMAYIIKRVLESKKDTRYSAIKDDKRFQKILDRLGEYAD